MARDNQLVYYEKCPDASSLPNGEPKVHQLHTPPIIPYPSQPADPRAALHPCFHVHVPVQVLARPLPLDTLLTEALDSPLPLSVRHPEEEGAGEPARALFGRLDTEFKRIPLSERVASTAGHPGGDSAASASAAHRGSKDPKDGIKDVVGNASARLSSFFGRSASTSTDSGSARKSASEKPEGPTAAKSTPKPTAAAADDEDDALQKALEASLRYTCYPASSTLSTCSLCASYRTFRTTCPLPHAYCHTSTAARL